MKIDTSTIACTILLFGIASTNGFQQLPTPRAAMMRLASTKANAPVSTGYDSFERIKSLTDVPSGEGQRAFRRTVYTHDDWVRHRKQDRFVVYLAAIFSSGVYKNLAREVLITTSIASGICIWNAIAGGYTDFSGVAHDPLIQSTFFPKLGLPMAAFTLTSPSLGLLLVFRTNTSYQRWDEARKNWGMNINHTRDLVRMANAYYDARGVSEEQRQDELKHVALCTWAFVRAMKRHLSPEQEDEEAFREELLEKLTQKQAEMIIAAAHRPNRALQDLSYAIDDLPMHFIRKHEIHRAVTIFEDDLGSSERILTSPVPLFYSRHLARFLAVWLFLLPFGAYDAFASSWNHIALIPAATVISTMLFGIEEIGTQLEEPFTVLPMQAFCDKIYNWCTEIVSWTPGDNGRSVRPIKPEHAYFAKAVGQGTIGASPVVPQEAEGGASGSAKFSSESITPPSASSEDDDDSSPMVSEAVAVANDREIDMDDTSAATTMRSPPDSDDADSLGKSDVKETVNEEICYSDDDRLSIKEPSDGSATLRTAVADGAPYLEETDQAQPPQQLLEAYTLVEETYQNESSPIAEDFSSAFDADDSGFKEETYQDQPPTQRAQDFPPADSAPYMDDVFRDESPLYEDRSLVITEEYSSYAEESPVITEEYSPHAEETTTYQTRAQGFPPADSAPSTDVVDQGDSPLYQDRPTAITEEYSSYAEESPVVNEEYSPYAEKTAYQTQVTTESSPVVSSDGAPYTVEDTYQGQSANIESYPPVNPDESATTRTTVPPPPPPVDPRGLGSRGLQAVQRWRRK